MDIIRGAFDKPVSTERLITALGKLEIGDGILYTGYPIIGALESKYSLDAILIAPQFGIILFDIVEESQISDRTEIRDTLYNAMVSRLINVKGLSGRRGTLNFSLEAITFAPAWPNSQIQGQDEIINSPENLKNYLDQISDIDKNSDKFERILETIQALTKLKLRPPRQVKSVNSKGAILNEVEKSISNLDRHQSKAVIEISTGIQRIRGLAGSGKTVILALKAAYLHSKYPEWKIGVTFNSRALKNQFKELITKFTIEHKNEEPDFTKIKIMQAWGSPSDDGFYYQFCKLNGINYHSLDSAKAKYGNPLDPLGKICNEALTLVKNPITDFDVILIDEAQDFSEYFLRICYNLLRSSDKNNLANRRLVYAYDELQKLNELSLKSPKEIFGEGIDFVNDTDKPSQDVILNICYRNSAPVLVTAHGLGFGIYRKGIAKEKTNLVTMFQEKELWKDVGYKVVGGELELGKTVELSRDKGTSPELLTNHATIDDIVQFHNFDSVSKQNEWIADQIYKNIMEDELSYEDIIVIHPNAWTAKSETAPLRGILSKKGINSHLAGVSTSRDEFYVNGSIAFTSIFRAKGNEAAMVYIMHTDFCFGGYELIKKRNILFTAITRSKGWVRACGVGEGMAGLIIEFQQIKSENFHLKFHYPTEEEMNLLNVIHRDLSEEEKKKIDNGNNEAKSLLDKLENNEIKLEDLSKEVLDKLKKKLSDDTK